MKYPKFLSDEKLSVADKHDRLNDLIKWHRYLYYELYAPEIQDHEYDLLYRKLVDMENENPELVTPESSTQQVGWTPGAMYERKYND